MTTRRWILDKEDCFCIVDSDRRARIVYYDGRALDLTMEKDKKIIQETMEKGRAYGYYSRNKNR